MKQVRQFSVFVSSPGDVRDERALAVKVLDALPFKPWARGQLAIETVSWDDDRANVPSPAHLTPQQAINKGLAKPSECDVVVVFLWSRLGTPIPASASGDGKSYRSGTEWEYLDAIAAVNARAPNAPARPYVLVFRRNQDPGFKRSDANYDELNSQWQQVDDFFRDYFSNEDGSLSGSVISYETQTEFQGELDRQLVNYFWHELGEPAPDGKPQARWSGEPYPGLSPFEASQAQIFFGRGPETDELVRRIMMPSRPLLAVIGASGSGKSSLVKAGLLPRLRDAYPNGWIIVDFTPDELGTKNPFASIAAAVGRTLNVRIKAPELEQDPRRFGAAVQDAVEDATDSDAEFPRAVIFVDQFEELFARVDEQYRNRFIDALIDAAERPRVQVVLTLRGDFYSYCTEHEALAALLRDGSYPLAPPGDGALRDMIRGPAELVGLELDDRLVQRILDDTGNQPGALALMAYTLAELFRLGDHSGGFSIAEYEALQGVKGALGKRSEDIFVTLDESVQAALPRVFRRLVQIDLNGAATKIRAPLRDVEVDAESRALVEAFTGARLLVTDKFADRTPYVEVAHESLFRHWLRLSQWIEDVASHLRVWRQAQDATVEWERLGRPNYLLWPQERQDLYRAALEALDLEPDQNVARFLRPEWQRLYETIDRDGITDAERQSNLLRMLEFGEEAAGTLVLTLAAINRRGLESAVREKLSASAESIRDAAARMLGGNVEEEQVAAVTALSSLYDADTLPLLIDALDSGSTEVRLTVFRELRADGDEVRALFRKGLADHEPRVRRAVFDELDYVQTSLIVAELDTAFDDSDEPVRKKALDVLDKTADRGLMPHWIDATVAALRSRHASVAARAKALLDRLDPAEHQSSACFDALLAALADTPAMYRDTVIAAIRRCADGRPGIQLEPLLRHADAELRAIGATAFGQREYAPGEDLVPLLNDTAAEVREAAVTSLGQLEYSDAGPAILAMVEIDGGDPAPRVRAAAARAVGALGTSGSEDVLVALMDDPDAWVRAAAIRTLGDVARDAATIRRLADTLPDLLEAESAAVRAAAAGAYGAAIRLETGSVTDLVALAKDDLGTIRAGVARGLSACRDADAERLLLLMLDDSDAEVRAAAARSIGALQIDGAAARIVSLLKDEPDVRNAAHDALVEIADGSIRRELVGYLQDPDAAVRRAAITLLIPVCGADAAHHLVESLVDPDYDNRYAATELLRTHGTAELIPLIVGIARTGSHEANQAVNLLGDLGDAGAVAPLGEMVGFDDFPQYLRSQAIAAIGEIGGREAEEMLVSILRGPEISFRGDAVQALAVIRRKTESANEEADHRPLLIDCKTELLGMLAAHEARTRADALFLLGSIADPDLTTPILAGLSDGDASVRAAAARALGVLGATSNVAELLQATADLEPRVRRAAVWALGQLADPAALDTLIDIAEKGDDEDSWLQRFAVEAIAAIPDAQATSKLRDWARTETWPERDIAIKALGARDAAGATDLLHELLDDSDAAVRRAAIDALGKLRNPLSIPWLLSAVASGDSSDSYNARRALQEIRIDKPTTELLDALKSDDDRVAAAAAVVLGNSGNTDMIPVLIEAIEDGSLSSYRAAEAFESLDDDAALEVLAELSRSARKARREAVAAALRNHSGKKVVSILLPMLTDEEFGVRYAAGQSLANSFHDIDRDNLLDIARRNPKSRAGIAQAMTGLPDAVPTLRDMAEGADAAIQSLVVEALGNIGEPAAVDALAAFADSPFAEVRLQVAAALRRRHASERLPVLLKLSCDPEDEVRYRSISRIHSIPTEDLLSRLTELSVKDQDSKTLVVNYIRSSQALFDDDVTKSLAPQLAELFPQSTIPASATDPTPADETDDSPDESTSILSNLTRWWHRR